MQVEQVMDDEQKEGQLGSLDETFAERDFKVFFSFNVFPSCQLRDEVCDLRVRGWDDFKRSSQEKPAAISGATGGQ